MSKTARVRIAVAIDSKGNWFAAGTDYHSDQEKHGNARASLPFGGKYARITFVEADVLLPPDIESVEGRVVP